MPWVGLGLLDARGDSLDKPPNIFICDACVLIRERTFEHDKVLDRSTNHPILVRRDQFESQGRDSHNTSWSLRLVPFMRSCFNGQTGFGMSSLTSFRQALSRDWSLPITRPQYQHLLMLFEMKSEDSWSFHQSVAQKIEPGILVIGLGLSIESTVDSSIHCPSRNNLTRIIICSPKIDIDKFLAIVRKHLPIIHRYRSELRRLKYMSDTVVSEEKVARN